jgi:cobalamin biosynthesis protein CbiD
LFACATASALSAAIKWLEKHNDAVQITVQKNTLIFIFFMPPDISRL